MPASTPVTTPVLPTVAMIIALLLQVPPASPVRSVRFVVAPGQTVNVPVMAPAFGAGLTVTIAVAARVLQILVTV